MGYLCIKRFKNNDTVVDILIGLRHNSDNVIYNNCIYGIFKTKEKNNYFTISDFIKIINKI